MPLGELDGMNTERRGQVGTQQGVADQAAAALRGEEGVVQDNS